jgi:hypothetical protein
VRHRARSRFPLSRSVVHLVRHGEAVGPAGAAQGRTSRGARYVTAEQLRQSSQEKKQV